MILSNGIFLLMAIIILLRTDRSLAGSQPQMRCNHTFIWLYFKASYPMATRLNSQDTVRCCHFCGPLQSRTRLKQLSSSSSSNSFWDYSSQTQNEQLCWKVAHLTIQKLKIPCLPTSFYLPKARQTNMRCDMLSVTKREYCLLAKRRPSTVISSHGKD